MGCGPRTDRWSAARGVTPSVAHHADAAAELEAALEARWDDFSAAQPLPCEDGFRGKTCQYSSNPILATSQRASKSFASAMAFRLFPLAGSYSCEMTIASMD